LKKPEPAAYNLDFSVTPQASQSRQNYVGFSKGTLKVKVVTSVVISDFEINIQDSPDDVMHRKISVNFNEQAKRLAFVPKQKVVVSFKVRNQVQQRLLRPRQAFLKFTHVQNLHEFYVVAKLDPTLHFSATLNLAVLKGISGEYRGELIVGDTFVQNQIVWEFGTFDLTFGENSDSRPALEKRSLFPEIRHEFRLPEKRPNPFISLVFSGLVLAPIFFLLIGWLSVGVNIRHFPFSGPQFLYAVGFHVCLGAILALFVLYWLELTMFQTLGYLALLAVPTIPLGQQALRYVHIANLPKAKAE
jgi:oligosaccharyltransferase complex subunit delta (ribophorin II)